LTRPGDGRWQSDRDLAWPDQLPVAHRLGAGVG
jgi:hypothetical protein